MSDESRAFALFSCARLAIRSARNAEREAAISNDKWADHFRAEAKRAREDAAWYLQQRRFILDDAWSYWESAA